MLGEGGWDRKSCFRVTTCRPRHAKLQNRSVIVSCGGRRHVVFFFGVLSHFHPGRRAQERTKSKYVVSMHFCLPTAKHKHKTDVAVYTFPFRFRMRIRKTDTVIIITRHLFWSCRVCGGVAGRKGKDTAHLNFRLFCFCLAV